jgi:hypothetical protein
MTAAAANVSGALGRSGVVAVGGKVLKKSVDVWRDHMTQTNGTRWKENNN